jgi:hypothetical protein
VDSIHLPRSWVDVYRLDVLFGWMSPMRAATDEVFHLCGRGSDYGIGDSPFDKFYLMVADELGFGVHIVAYRHNNRVS